MQHLDLGRELRVCVVTPGPVGQTETFIRAHLERLPHHVEHVYGSGSDLFWRDKLLRGWVGEARGVFLRRLLSLLPRFLEFRLARKFAPHLSDVEVFAFFLQQRRIDVVLAEYGTTGARITPACAAAGVPLVVHFHGFDASRYDVIEAYRESYLKMFVYASSVVAVSKKMYADLLVLGCSEDKLVVNHYGPDHSFFDIAPDYESNEVLMVGRLTEKKAPYLSLLAFREALKSCPDLKLTIIGSGELEGVCRDLVTVLALDNQVRFLGALGPEQVREVMRRSFLFIQHSIKASNGDCEGTPVAILEAGAAGVPVVSTGHAGIPDVVVHNEGGRLVLERDVAGMSDAIVSFASDRKKAEKFGQSIRKRIKKYFTMEKHIYHLSNELIKACSSKNK